MPDRPRSGGRTRPATQPPEFRHPDWARRLTAELVGAFGLVLAAAGTDVVGRLTDGAVSDAARAVAPGLVVAALIYSIGDASGAHFNPAVSLAFALKRLIPPGWVVPYWLAQLAGAVLAAALLRALFGDAVDAAVNRPRLTSDTGAVVVEGALSFLLLVVILGTADRYRVVGANAAIAVGATIAACGLVGLPIEGASMNPARSLGPAIVAGDVGSAWIYVLGPVAGAAMAVVLTTFLHGPRDDDDGAGEAARGGS
jgi:aquaporin Z